MKENLRRLFAAAFLILLLAEWGSHGMLNASSSSADEQAITANEKGHDDPCRYMVLCSDNGRKDRQQSNFRHEVMHDALLDLLLDSCATLAVHDDPLIPFTTADRLFRPPSPPFHPPEFS